MKREPHAASQSVSREASEWFVFLQDDPDDLSLRHRFEQWLNTSPAHQAAWAETLRAASLSESLLPFDARQWRSADRDGEGDGDVDEGRVRTGHRKWAVAIGTLAVAAALAFLAMPAMLLRLEADFRTGTAELRQIDLQDGSTVTLAADSAIAIDYAANERRVRLLSGEAFFSVTPDLERPFRVATQSVTVSVLGTSFDVDIQRDGVAVAVVEGRVKVTSHGVDETLDGGQAIRVAAQAALVDRTTRSPMAASAWRHGQLLMEDRPFAEAVGALERYYTGSILVVGGALRDRPVTGVFDLRDPEAALRTMAKALGAEVRRVSPWLLVVTGF